MKAALLLGLLVLTMVWGNGCITIHTNEDGLCWPAVYWPGAVLLQDADAVTGLGLEDNRGGVPIGAARES